jgi:hypothetical protein
LKSPSPARARETGRRAARTARSASVRFMLRFPPFR